MHINNIYEIHSKLNYHGILVAERIRTNLSVENKESSCINNSVFILLLASWSLKEININ